MFFADENSEGSELLSYVVDVSLIIKQLVFFSLEALEAFSLSLYIPQLSPGFIFNLSFLVLSGSFSIKYSCLPLHKMIFFYFCFIYPLYFLC